MIMTTDNKNGSPREKVPWWREATYITAIAAVLAAILPATALINGWYQTRSEDQSRVAEIRLKYLDRAIDPDRNEEDRAAVLKFLVEILSSGDPMKRWAQSQLDNLTEFLQMRVMYDSLEAEFGKLTLEYKVAQLENQDRAQVLRDALRLKQSELTRVKKELATTEARASVLPDSVQFPGKPPAPLTSWSTNPRAVPELPGLYYDSGGYLTTHPDGTPVQGRRIRP